MILKKSAMLNRPTVNRIPVCFWVYNTILQLPMVGNERYDAVDCPWVLRTLPAGTTRQILGTCEPVDLSHFGPGKGLSAGPMGRNRERMGRGYECKLSLRGLGDR